MRILLVEDEPTIARDITRALTATGYIVDRCSTGTEAWERGEVETFDGAILDLGLPGIDGMQLLKLWRAAGRAFPVIVVSARGSWRERVEGIDAGADDYLPKPFQMDELLSRLNAVIRRSAGQSQTVLDIGPLSIDQRHSKVSLNGVPVTLTPLEYRLLAILALRRGKPVSQTELSEHLYAVGVERETNAIEAIVGRLRKKLSPDIIQTRRGFGYLINEELVGTSDSGGVR